jgi:hypothetical protein
MRWTAAGGMIAPTNDTRMAGKLKLFWLNVVLTMAHRPVVPYDSAGGGTTGLVNGVIT